MSALVLLYHDIADEASLVSTREDVFARQMQWLHEQGCPVVSLTCLLECLRIGGALPPRAVALTFDDGFESVYRRALPILRHFGFPATVFLVSGYSGARNDWPGQPPDVPARPLLTWPQIREMEGYEIEFGAHGLSHTRLDRLPAEVITAELLHSKAALERELGHRVDLLAYPYGRYNAVVKSIAQGVYSAALAASPGVVTPRSDPFALPRVEAHYLANPHVYQRLLHPLFPGYLLFRRGLRVSASVVLRRAWR